jgi:AraC-like DNA-binding protein
MKPAMEPPRVPWDGKASLFAYERRAASFAWNWHYHPEIELTLILRGRGTRLIGDHSEEYRPGDLILLGPNLPHSWISADDTRPASGRNRAIVIQFLPQAIPAAILALPEFAPIQRLLAESGRGLRFPAATAKSLRDELAALAGCDGLARWLGLAAAFGRLAMSPRAVLASVGHRHRRSSRLSSRLERVTSHLERHFRDDLPISRAAAMVGVSAGTFSRFFRKMTHRTFVDYRNALRVAEACRLLEESDLPVIEVAYACGFNNLANFNRRFRREKGMVPRDYRRLHEPA